MDLQGYIERIVDPTIGDLEANPTSVRHAFLARVVTFHMIDYLAHPKKPAAIRTIFGSRSPEFAIVDRVAHAFKHVSTGHVNNAFKRPLANSEVISRPPAYYDVSGCYDLSRYDDAVGGVTLDKERGIDLLSTVRKAAEFVRKYAEGLQPPPELVAG